MSRLLHIIHVLLLVVMCLASEQKNGLDFFQEGLRLVNDDNLDEGAMNFWASVINYQNEFPYTVDSAMQNFLMCYQRQNKLGLGFAFVAAHLHKANDGRARLYLQNAYRVDPTNPDILQLMYHMGETTKSILSKHKYSLDEDETLDNPTKSTNPHACRTRADCRRFITKVNHQTLEPAWDENIQNDYVNARLRLSSTPEMSVRIPPHGPFQVKFDTFWNSRFKQGQQTWEPETFRIFETYITKNTIVIDFGAWYGPTALFSAQLAKKVYALEPDPVAYCTIEHNVRLNPDLDVDVHAIAVVAPQDAGNVSFQTGKMGNSESMLVSDVTARSGQHFKATGYTLPFLFNLWGINFTNHPVFIKIDIETYECKLIPSFHEWLVEEDNLENLTILVSFHPQLKPCSKKQMMGVLETFKLFGRVSCNNHATPLPISPTTSFEAFETMLDAANCLTHKDDSDFVLSKA